MKIEILAKVRKEKLLSRIKRLFGIGPKVTHWQVYAAIDGKVRVPNLLKLDNSFKMVVRWTDGKHIKLETIRPVAKVPEFTSYHIRMEHWKF